MARARVLLLAAVLLAALRFWFFARDAGFAIDDAWVSFRVARNLVEHGALTYDLSRAPVEGMTNLLWTLLCAGFLALFPRIDPLFFAQLLGGVCHLATVALAGWTAAEWAASDLREGTDLLSVRELAAGCAASGSLAFYAASGLETALDGLLFLAAVRAVLRESSWAGVFLGLLALSRPEGVLAGALICAWVVAERRAQAVRMVAPFAAAVAGVEIFRLAYYGALVPNTFHAKTAVWSEGFATLRDFVLHGLGVLGPLALVPALRSSRAARWLAGIAAVLAAGVVWSGGDWMPGYRRFEAAMLAFALLAGVGVAAARGRWRWLSALGVAASIAGSVAATALTRDGQRTATVLGDLGRAAQATPGVRDVALVDIGRFGWAFRGSIFDLGALTDARLARRPGSHLRKKWDAAYFAERHPDLVVLQSHGNPWRPGARILPARTIEADALEAMDALGDYALRAAAPMVGDEYYLVFSRRRVALPAAAWGRWLP